MEVEEASKFKINGSGRGIEVEDQYIEVEGKWKWKIDGSGRGIKVYSVREIKVAAANCKKSVQSCIELM